MTPDVAVHGGAGGGLEAGVPGRCVGGPAQGDLGVAGVRGKAGRGARRRAGDRRGGDRDVRGGGLHRRGAVGDGEGRGVGPGRVVRVTGVLRCARGGPVAEVPAVAIGRGSAGGGAGEGDAQRDLAGGRRGGGGGRERAADGAGVDGDGRRGRLHRRRTVRDGERRGAGARRVVGVAGVLQR